MNLLEVCGLRTEFYSRDGIIPAVDRIHFNLNRGEILGLVGESGCGKSVTALSLLRLISPPGKIVAGEIFFENQDLLRLPEKQMRAIRGNKIAMIFQEPMTSLNPVMAIGDQVGESLRIHQGYNRNAARLASVELLKSVRIPDAERIAREYPHQLSGGMRQRAMIAMAIACKPLLLIADEPTTALDVTIQAQILDLLRDLREQYGIAILLITHALGVVAETADRVVVMYAGKIVEEAPVLQIFESPKHPYTKGLLNSIPRMNDSPEKAKRLETIDGAVPNLVSLPSGCAFFDRCKEHMPRCKDRFPEDFNISADHRTACYLYSNESA